MEKGGHSLEAPRGQPRFRPQRPNMSKLIVLAVLASLFAILACSKDDSTPAAQLSTEATATAQPTATATPQEASSEPAKDEQPSEPAAQLSAEATATAQPTATATPQEAGSEPVKDEQPSDVQRVTVTFRAISSGEHHTCGLREDGSAVCWGDNRHGRASPPEGGIFTAISKWRVAHLWPAGRRVGGVLGP